MFTNMCMYLNMYVLKQYILKNVCTETTYILKCICTKTIMYSIYLNMYVIAIFTKTCMY